jgi:hypothetical protein
MRRVVSSLAAASAAGNGSRPPAPNDARAPAVAWHTPGVGVVRRIARQKPLRPALGERATGAEVRSGEARSTAWSAAESAGSLPPIRTPRSEAGGGCSAASRCLKFCGAPPPRTHVAADPLGGGSGDGGVDVLAAPEGIVMPAQCAVCVYLRAVSEVGRNTAAPTAAARDRECGKRGGHAVCSR